MSFISYQLFVIIINKLDRWFELIESGGGSPVSLIGLPIYNLEVKKSVKFYWANCPYFRTLNRYMT